jgi:predicted RNA-binding protein with PUA-like domain
VESKLSLINGAQMSYWILKTEPGTYSFEDLLRDGKTRWDGVRNYQARNNLREMKTGDLAVIYHSGDVKAAVGLAKVIKPAYKDPTSDDDWAAIDLVSQNILEKPVALSMMKADKILKNMALVKNSRLSVSPLSKAEYDLLLKLSK